MRYVDDFLLITREVGVAREFLTTMQGGVASYNCSINPTKTVTNFTLSNEVQGEIKYLTNGKKSVGVVSVPPPRPQMHYYTPTKSIIHTPQAPPHTNSHQPHLPHCVFTAFCLSSTTSLPLPPTAATSGVDKVVWIAAEH